MGKLIAGIGFFDRKGPYRSREGGKTTKAYDVWSNMIRRCYQESHAEINPSYADCTVCDEWHNFTKFAEWFYREYPNDGEKYHLDKDLLSIGSKVYSPETCLLVTRGVNNFMLDSCKTRGKYLIGVCFDKQTGRFRASCRDSLKGKTINLGRFDSEIDAHMAWRLAKFNVANELASSQADKRVRGAIMKWAERLKAMDLYPLHGN